MHGMQSTYWNRQVVETCLDGYQELCHLCDFVGSNWLAEVRSGHGVRTYPSNFSLLSTKWDLELAVRRLESPYQLLFYLRFWRRLGIGRVARILNRGAATVWRMERRLPTRILEILRTGKKKVKKRYDSPALDTSGGHELGAARY